jgi:ribosome-associated protein
MTDAVTLARKIAQIALDARATNIVILDIGQLSTIADAFVICSVDNVRQLGALFNSLTSKLREEGIGQRRGEGVPEAGWILLDYGDVIVHLFTESQRSFYQIDGLWGDAPRLLVIQ